MMELTQPAVVNFDSAPHSVEIRDYPIPRLEPDQVLLEVAAVGVCGSDLHMWRGKQGWKVNYPCILGHEFAGSIAQKGNAVSEQWQVGDRAVSETAAIIDTNSPMTRRGLYNLDPNRKGFGAAVNGAMTHYVPVPERILHRIPDNLSYEVAALCEPCCVAYNAVCMNADIHPGDRILVIGPGPIGILCAALARLRGAEVAILGLAHDRARLDIAQAYGCTVIMGDPINWSRSLDGLGVDGVVDATGVTQSLKQALEAVRPSGWISKVGWGTDPVDFSLDPLVQKNIKLQGSFSHHWKIWERVLRLLSTGQLDVRPIIGGIWPLAKWHEAFETMHSAAIVKAVLRVR